MGTIEGMTSCQHTPHMYMYACIYMYISIYMCVHVPGVQCRLWSAGPEHSVPAVGHYNRLRQCTVTCMQHTPNVHVIYFIITALILCQVLVISGVQGFVWGWGWRRAWRRAFAPLATIWSHPLKFINQFKFSVWV